jgi:hypothetical protein
MTTTMNTGAASLSDEQIEALKAAALAATPQDIDSAQEVERFPDGSRYCTCPACDGEGHVDLEADFCNYDGHALGVQFYGIGTEHGAAEAYFRAVKPATILALIDRLERAEATPTPQADAAPSRDVAQLADWLLIDPQTGKRLTFAGPLERDFLGMSRVKMASADGENVWTLTAGLKEGYLTADERAANLSRIAEQEREEAREPSLEQLREMAYLLDIVPRGEVVCVQFLDVLRKQYRAAMEASGV